MKLGYCPMGNGDSIGPFDELFSEKVDVSKSVDGVDAVVFWGGTDICPQLYNEERSWKSQAQANPSSRDLFEWDVMRYCKLRDIPVIGICRGAQLLCAFNGGTLVQHCDNHGNGNHMVMTHDGMEYSTTSCHHQMMYPYDIEHKLLAWASPKRSSVYLDGRDKQILAMEKQREPEVVYFPQNRGLAIQGHPEWMPQKALFVQWVLTLTESILKEKTNV